MQKAPAEKPGLFCFKSNNSKIAPFGHSGERRKPVPFFWTPAFAGVTICTIHHFVVSPSASPRITPVHHRHFYATILIETQKKGRPRQTGNLPFFFGSYSTVTAFAP